MSFLIPLFLSLTFTFTKSDCNYAEFDLSIYNLGYSSLGTFSLSTNRCQSIKALIQAGKKPLAINRELKGSMKFVCSSNGNTLTLYRFTDEYCSDMYLTSKQSLKAYNSIYLANNLFRLTIKNLDCSSRNCHVSWSFGEDCSFSSSNYYLNMSLPPNKCETLSTNIPDTYKELIINTVETDVLPDFIVKDLAESSIKFGICSDCSLFMYNYTDAKCGQWGNYYKLSAMYNGKCFDVSKQRRRLSIIDEVMRRKLQNAKYVKAAVVSWSCADSVTAIDCSQFDEIKRWDLPPFCPSTCNAWKWDPQTTSSPLTNAGNKNTKVITISIIFVVGFVVILVMVYGYLKYRNMAKDVKTMEVIQQNNKVVLQSSNIDSKYKPMIEDSIEKDTGIVLPHSIDALDQTNVNNNNNNNQIGSYENTNYITVATATGQPLNSNNDA